MNSGVPWLFPYFRHRRGLNLSAGICAGDDHAHLKENNTLPPKHLALAWGWASLRSSSSHFRSRMKTEVGYLSQSWMDSNVEPRLRQQSEPKHRLCNMMTSSVPELTVEVSHLHQSNLMTWKSPLMLTRKYENANLPVITMCKRTRVQNTQAAFTSYTAGDRLLFFYYTCSHMSAHQPCLL